MPAHWEKVDSYRDDGAFITVYRPRNHTSIGTWLVLGAALVLGVIGSGTGSSGGAAPVTSEERAADESAGPVTAAVRAPGGLPVRDKPDPAAAQVSQLADDTWVVVACHTVGPPVVGRTGTSNVWVRVTPVGATSGFVPDALLSTRGDIRRQVPAC